MRRLGSSAAGYNSAMRMLMRLFRMFSGGGGRSTGRGGMGRSRRMGTSRRSGGGIGSMIRRFLR